MDIQVLDKDFNLVYILDKYESLIWVERWNTCGSFELYTTITPDIVKYMTPDNYIYNPDVPDDVFGLHLMIIEDVSIETNTEQGNHIKIVGRGLESILERRIVWTRTTFNDKYVNEAIDKLINDAIVSPTRTDRKISNFRYEWSSDPMIEDLKITRQYYGEDLMSIMDDICNELELGYSVVLDADNNFTLYIGKGVDYSYDQVNNVYIIFGPEYDNLISSNYVSRQSETKNVAIVVGEDNKTKVVGASSGLKRKETLIQATDIQKGSLSNSKYLALLGKRGEAELIKLLRSNDFDVEVNNGGVYQYGRDYSIGDIVQITNEFGIEAAARVTECTWNYSSSSVDVYPTFVALNDTISTGKNLIQSTLPKLINANTGGEWAANIYVYNGLTFTVNQDTKGRVSGITVSGTASANTAFYVGKVETVITTLSLSGCIDGSSSTYYLRLRDGSTTRTSNYSGISTISGFVPANNNFVQIYIANGKSCNTTFYPMIMDSNNSDKSFEPYGGN